MTPSNDRHPWPVDELRERVAARVVGRERELDLILAALAAGRDILLEGPPGTSKSTLLRAIAAVSDIPLLFVEGNADLTPGKLLGHHDPAQVLREGYREDNFIAGPLVEAMGEGGFLYIEEFNRAPDDTLNTLLTAMAEREVKVPRLGRIRAADSFRVIATMNPFDTVGTARLSMSIRDRFNRLNIGYQDRRAEADIVALRAPLSDRIAPNLADNLRGDAVTLTRATREHPDIRQGSSVRGAIDLSLVAGELLAMRGLTRPVDADRVREEEEARRRYAETVHDAMLVALSGRIHLDEAAATTAEEVLREIWEDHFVLEPATAERPEDGQGVEADSPVRRGEQDEPRRLRPLRRKPKELEEDPTLFQAAGGQGGVVLTAAGERGSGDGGDDAETTRGVTDEEARTLELDPGDEGLGDETLRRAREIADRLHVPRPARETHARRGLGELATVAYRGTAADVDLDATLETLVENPAPQPEDILVRERLRVRRAIVLAIDVSGSMRGERIRTAAATVGALASEFTRDDLGVIAFWSDAALLARPGEPLSAREILDLIVRIPAEGLTNVAFPLELAREQLAGSAAADTRVLLLSDCVHNAGPDPRTVAEALPRLDVLVDTSGEHDAELARDLARVGRGRLELLRGYRDVPPAITRIFTA